MSDSGFFDQVSDLFAMYGDFYEVDIGDPVVIAYHIEKLLIVVSLDGTT